MDGFETLEQILGALGDLLEEEHARYRILIVGGSSLLLLGFVIRPTADIDVIGFAAEGGYVKADAIPTKLAKAAARVGEAFRLEPGWFNVGPASLFDFGLPSGLEKGISVRTYGGLGVNLPGRYDLICFNLYAAVDHSANSDNKHLRDLITLEPTYPELLDAGRWAMTHDPSQDFRGELLSVLQHLGVSVSNDEL